MKFIIWDVTLGLSIPEITYTVHKWIVILKCFYWAVHRNALSKPPVSLTYLYNDLSIPSLVASIGAFSPSLYTFPCCWKFFEQASRATVTALPETNNTQLSPDLMPLLICLPWSNRPHHWRNLSPECVWWVLSYNSTQSLHLSERALTVSLITLVVKKGAVLRKLGTSIHPWRHVFS